MWALLLLFAILLPILLLSILVASVAAGIALLRRRGTGARVQFTGILFAYAALMILIGVFLAASGVGLIAKAGLAEAASKDFSYDRPGFQSNVNDAIREDVVYGVVLVVLGAVMLVPHIAGAYALRDRQAPGAATVSRGFNLIGLATATIGFLAAGGTALFQVLERAADKNTSGWQDYHPGEPLVFAVLLGALCGWFAYRLWGDALRSIDAIAKPEDLVTAP